MHSTCLANGKNEQSARIWLWHCYRKRMSFLRVRVWKAVVADNANSLITQAHGELLGIKGGARSQLVNLNTVL
jgi:hypothetical protein